MIILYAFRRPKRFCLCCDKGNNVRLLCLACLEERNSVPSFSALSLSCRQAMQRSSNLLTPSKQNLHYSTVSAGTELSETLLGQWDQARLSSLVNKQVAQTLPDAAAGFLWLYSLKLMPARWNKKCVGEFQRI